MIGDHGLAPHNNEHHFGLLRVDDSPKPSYITYQTTARALWGKTFVGDILGEFGNVRGYLFERGDDRTAVLWALQGEERITLPIDAPLVELFTADGTPIFPKTENGHLAVSLSEKPLFLSGTPLGALRRMACVRVTAPVDAPLHGIPLPITLEVSSTSPGEETVAVRAEPFPGGAVEPSETTCRVGHAAEGLKFVLKPPDAADGKTVAGILFTVTYPDGFRVTRKFQRYMPYPWLVCGPFPNRKDMESGKAKGRTPHKGFSLDTDYLAEHGGESALVPEPGMVVSGAKTPEAGVWRPARKFRGELIDFAKEFGEDNTWGVAYAFHNIRAAKPGRVRFMLGCTAGVKVWINHKLVHRGRNGNPFRDTDVFDVDLKAGNNPCLVKVDQGYGEWRVYLRPLREGDTTQSVVSSWVVQDPF
jgi:hypothetical protein